MASSMPSGNIDEIAQSIAMLGDLIVAATKRETTAVKYHSVTAVDELREFSRKFSCGTVTYDQFAEEIKRINTNVAQHQLDARAAKDNIAYLNARIIQLTKVRTAMIQVDAQTKRLTELQSEYKKSVDLREQALKDKDDALRAFIASESMIEAKREVPTLALFDSLCVSLGAPTGTSMVKEPTVIAPVAVAPVAVALVAVALVAKPANKHCSNARCFNLATHPVTISGAPGKVFCSVDCARSK